MPDQKITAKLSDQNNRSINLDTPNTVGVCTLTTDQLAQFQNNRLDIKGFTKGGHGAIIINVDCAGKKEISLPQEACVFIDGQKQSTNEVTEFSAGKVIWNFTNAKNTTIRTKTMTGIILAPGATVIIESNLNGTVVADTIEVRAESHRTDFTGRIRNAPLNIKDAYVILQKVDQENVGKPLTNAEFDLYKWSPNAEQYDFYMHYECDSNGQMVLEDLDYNTAYMLLEVAAPSGYVLNEQPHYFCFDHENTGRYPLCRPSDFVGTSFDSGDIRYIRNEQIPPPEMTSIIVEKSWRSESSAPIEPEETEIQFELWRRSSLGGEEKLDTYTLTAAADWRIEIPNLIKADTNDQGRKVSYAYYLKEIPLEDYIATYENNGGISGGSIRMINIQQPVIAYELPKTGGAGTLPYTAGGLLLLAASIFLLYNNKKCGKEDRAS